MKFQSMSVRSINISFGCAFVLRTHVPCEISVSYYRLLNAVPKYFNFSVAVNIISEHYDDYITRNAEECIALVEECFLQVVMSELMIHHCACRRRRTYSWIKDKITELITYSIRIVI